MKQYWKNYVWEYLMCVVAASMLLLNAAQGFYIPDKLADNILLAVAACAVLMLFFFVGGYNKVSMVLVPVITGVFVVLCVLILRSKGVDIVDEEGSDTAFYIYWFAFAVICIAVYLCSRFRLGIAVLFLAGCCVSAILQFLEYQVFTWAGMVFAGSCIVLFLLRQYRAQALNSSTAQPNFRRFFQSGFLVVLVAALLSCGVFFAVIRPLAPPTVELKFLERYLAFNIIEHTGISDNYQIEDDEQYTDEKDDTLDNTEEIEEGETPISQDEDTPDESEKQENDDARQPPGQVELSAVSYTVTPVLWVILWCILILLVLLLPPALRIWLRKHRMKRIAAMEPAAQIQSLYYFYLKKFRHLGWKKRSNETPLEFAARGGDALERYLSGTCGLDDLTNAFMEVRYGGGVPADSTCDACRAIYGVFLKNCKRQMGTVRYLSKFYVL